MTTATRRPNFLLFITDQQRADHLGAYGNTLVRTPHLDALAARGWHAQACHVASPICMPNRASLMTGRMPSVHGARHNGIELGLDQTTFVERLREAGYATALVGKGHLQNISGRGPMWPPAGSPPTQGEARRPPDGRLDQEWEPAWDADPAYAMEPHYYGFDTVRLVINHGDTAGGHYKRWLQREHPQVAARTGAQHALPTPDFELSRCQQAWRTTVPEELSTTSYVGNQTCQLLEEYAGASQPFFIQCSFPDPHHPFTPPGRFWDMYLPQDMPLPDSFDAPTSGPMPHLDWMHAQRDAGRAVKNSPAMFAATRREVREALALNYGSISHIDETVGRVLAQLAGLGLAEDTVVLFTSDHGDYFGDHQLLWKGPLDIIARLVSTRMTATLRQPVVVENVTGAAGNIGAAQVARASPDGYTLLLSIDTPFTLTPALNPTGSVNPADFRPIGLGGVTGSILAVNTALGVDSLQALIAKGRSELLAFASAGSGSPGHFGALMLAQTTGIKVNPIHYCGNAPAVLALVSGEVQAGILGAGGLLPQIKAGKVKALAVAGASRSPLLPDLPTFAELGQSGLELEFLFVAMVPAATPDAVVDVLSRAMADAVAQPDYQERMHTLDIVRSPLTGQAITTRLAQMRSRYAAVIKSTGMKSE